MQDSQSLEQAKSFFISGLEKLNGNDFAGAEIDFESSLKYLPNRISTLINLSIVLIKLDKFENAEKLINEGLIHHPKNKELLMGLVEIYQKLIINKPGYSEAYANLGNSYKELNMHDESLEAYNTAIILNTNLVEVYSNRGNVFQDLKKYQEALEDYNKAIAVKPDFASAYFNRGIALREIKRLDDALTSYNQAIKYKPDYAEAYYNRGIALSELNYLDEALASYDQAIEINPDYVQAYSNRGNVLQDLNRLDEALASNDRAIEINPDYTEAYLNKGNICKELLRLDEALASYGQAILLKPDYAEAYYNSGVIFGQLKLHEQALTNYEKAITLNPNYAEAYSNRGNELIKLLRKEEALASYNQAILIKSDYAEAYYNSGVILGELKLHEQALTRYEKAITLNPNYAEAYSNRGNILKELLLTEEALASYDIAILIKPDYAEAYYNSGVILGESNRLEQALTFYEKAIDLKPDFAEAYSNRGNVLKDLHRLDESIASYDLAIEINPKFAEAYSNRGNVLKDLNLLEEALANYTKAIELRPDYEYLLGTKLHTKMLMCDWQDFEVNIEKLSVNISEGNKSSSSFSVLGFTDSLSIHHKASEIWINDKHSLNTSLGIISKIPRKEKIKIGYYSADFREHPVSYLTVEFFELHNKNQFELIAFYSGAPDSSYIQRRISLAFDEFINIRYKSDKEVAELSRAMGIAIAIDLTGLTANERVGIFAYRAAPIQLSYIGYLGTIGAEYYDYLIADKTIIPVESQIHYSEKIVYLPSYQVNDSKRLIANKFFMKTELNLPLNGFVFCCLNNNYKILPSTFDGWMRILNAVPDSVLFLYAANKAAEVNLRMEAKKRGVNQDRLVFASRIERSEYLARYKVADLFLDTLPYNAGTTASDALWAGLPVLTCMGESFASRVAASLLNAIELPDLITSTQAEYEARAIELANNPDKLKAIKDKLQRNRLTTALFDTPRFTKNIEAAYKKMYENYHDDLPINHIYIEA